MVNPIPPVSKLLIKRPFSYWCIIFNVFLASSISAGPLPLSLVVAGFVELVFSSFNIIVECIATRGVI
jgi:hypothetical protein